MKIAIVRGSYFNKYEMQNYEPLAKKHKIVGFSGLKPIHDKFAFPLIKLLSPVDLPKFPYKMPILNRLTLGDAMYLFGLEEKLKGFDIVHTRETYFHFTQQALDAKKKGYIKKVICTCSETIPFNHETIWFRKGYKKRAIKEVDRFHCLTNKAKQCLIKERCDPNKIIVFPYGVNMSIFNTHNKIRKKIDQQIKIIYVARLEKEKGIYIILKSIIKLIKSGYKIRIMYIGNGSEYYNLKYLINQTSLEKSIKIIHVSYPKIVNLYKKSNIFCLLPYKTNNWEEYFGMAVIEAMACGLPVVVSKSGVLSEVVGKAGFIVNESDNILQTTSILKKLIISSKLRQRYERLAYQRATKLYSSTKVSQNIDKLWKTTLK